MISDTCGLLLLFFCYVHLFDLCQQILTHCRLLDYLVDLAFQVRDVGPLELLRAGLVQVIVYFSIDILVTLLQVVLMFLPSDS